MGHLLRNERSITQLRAILSEHFVKKKCPKKIYLFYFLIQYSLLIFSIITLINLLKNQVIFAYKVI